MARTRLPDGRKWLWFDKYYNKNISKHFKASEFACQGRGCCSKTPIDPQLIAILENIREHFGKPVMIGSGYRCSTHNGSVKNAATGSLHMADDQYKEGSATGILAAADIDIPGVSCEEIAQYAELIGVNGIGRYGTGDTALEGSFVHIDTRLTQSFWLDHAQKSVPGNTYGATPSDIKVDLPSYTINSDNTYVYTDSDGLSKLPTDSSLKLPQEPEADFTGLFYNKDNKPLICWQSNSSGFTETTTMTVRGIVIHSSNTKKDSLKTYVQPADDAIDKTDILELIGSNSTYSDWNHKTTSESYNACVGKLEDGTISSVQTMPWSYRAWASGGGTNGTCNDGWIQILVCEHDASDEGYFGSVYSELCNLIAYLCRLYQLNPKDTTWCGGVSVPVVMSHNEAYFAGVASHSQEIQNWFPLHGKSMHSLREDVFRVLNGFDAITYPVTVGSVVTINDKSISRDGDPVQSWMQNKKWFVEESEESDIYCLLGKSVESEKLVLNEWFLKRDVTITDAAVAVDDLSVQVDTSTLEGSIWSTLIGCEFDGKPVTKQGAAALMGNLYAESGLRSNNMHDTHEKQITQRSGMAADEWYTSAVDDDRYKYFATDGVGYGLANWKFYTAKNGLLNLARERGVSISNLDVQLEYLLLELENHRSSNIPQILVNTHATLSEVSDTLLADFFHADNQSESVKVERLGFSQVYLEKFDGYASCTHKDASGKSLGVVRDQIAANCLQSGYSGDTICSKCGKVIHYGRILNKTDHEFDWRGICKHCKFMGESKPTPEDIVSKEDLQEILQILYGMLDRE